MAIPSATMVFIPERNDSLLIVASYFWSDALNAFLFGHGPMTPTLTDVLMLTGHDKNTYSVADRSAPPPTHKPWPKRWQETKTFPNIESETNPTARRRCTSFREAVSSFLGGKLTPSRTAEYFRCFYIGFSEETTRWYLHQREDSLFENPDCFELDTNSFEDRIMEIFIKPRILPANFFSGKDSPTLIPDSSTIDLNNWLVAPFSTQQFKLWWAEWKQHLFCTAPAVYCNQLDPTHVDPNAESDSQAPLTRSRSGRPIENRHPYILYPLIGYHTPSMEDIATGRLKHKLKMSTSKKTSRRVRARTESTVTLMVDKSATPLVEPSAILAPSEVVPTIQEINPQVVSEARSAAASLLVEAASVISHALTLLSMLSTLIPPLLIRLRTFFRSKPLINQPILKKRLHQQTSQLR
uniref:Aminotransferase-like plant mobile domain-containing protein n=1 Tax=Setaria viridis TaxID=4556 RepID=A0A4U6VGF2_SETVI|nr:hypothetical protein SEVIR_3G342600v2 [Setaria viridis]